MPSNTVYPPKSGHWQYECIDNSTPTDSRGGIHNILNLSSQPLKTNNYTTFSTCFTMNYNEYYTLIDNDI